ncbi:MAG: PIN domain-containing protein [Oscillospiraceae bacterium]|nr:PIN domain-containing protein [Oscillospiraceae bacterium]
MRKTKIYLDTSAIGYLDEQESPKEMAQMQALWRDIKMGKYDVFISQITLREINANKNKEKVEILTNYLAQIIYEFIEMDDEIRKIADLVKKNELLISENESNDRAHIGAAVVYGCNYLVSLNFKHLVNVKTVKGVRAIAALGGYESIDIVPPVMLLSEGVE